MLEHDDVGGNVADILCFNDDLDHRRNVAARPVVSEPRTASTAQNRARFGKPMVSDNH